MARVSPEAGALVRAGRAAFRPTTAHRDRVLAALSERLGDGLLDAPPRDVATGAHWAGRFGGLGWRLWPLVCVPVLGLGLGVMAFRSSPTTAPSIPTVVTPAAAVATAPAELAAAEPAPSPPESTSLPAAPPDERAPRPPASGAARAPAPRRVDGLSEEVRLLSSAERDINQGRAEEALRALTEHERRFPAGALAEERLAARVQALCAGGRRSEGRLYLAQLAQSYPRSSHLKRARAACSADADSTP